MNNANLKGIIQDIEYSHTINDVDYGKANLIVPGKAEDNIISIRYKQFTNPYKNGDQVELKGNVRSFSYSKLSGGNKVEIYVFTYFDIPQEDDTNFVQLDGRICKIDELRKTKSGRDILHFIVANNIIIEESGKKINSYIPCTCFDSLARQLSSCKVNDKVELEGRLNSRQYTKVLENQEIEIRTAHEVVLSKCDVLL